MRYLHIFVLVVSFFLPTMTTQAKVLALQCRGMFSVLTRNSEVISHFPGSSRLYYIDFEQDTIHYRYGNTNDSHAHPVIISDDKFVSRGTANCAGCSYSTTIDRTTGDIDVYDITIGNIVIFYGKCEEIQIPGKTF